MAQEKNLVSFLSEGGKGGREGGGVDEADEKSLVDLLTDAKPQVDFARSAASSKPARVRRLDTAQEKSLVSFLTKKR